MNRENLEQAAQNLVDELAAQGKTVTTAESLTGGLVAQSITAVPGASKVFGYGFVTYAEQAKADLVGVPMELIAREGVVSAPVAAAMAKGALSVGKADFALALTGLAGPDGGTEACPVGTVYIAVASRDAFRVSEEHFGNVGRQQVRSLAAAKALELGLDLLKK